jgi:DNA-binding MarR family transcriptional regulator
MMTRTVTTTRVLTNLVAPALLATLLAAAAAQAHVPAAPSKKSLQPAVRKYLEEKGDFCLGKFEWPIAVSADDRQAGTNNAQQMPVLEKLGLVVASDSPGDPSIRNYSLTEEGQKYYLTRQTITVNSAGQRIRHPGDLCPAKLELDKVVAWDPPSVVDGHAQTTVKYTYRIAKAADWTQDPEVRKVFPMIARILDHAGSQQLMQLFAWSGHRWVAHTPGD